MRRVFCKTTEGTAGSIHTRTKPLRTYKHDIDESLDVSSTQMALASMARVR